MAAPYDAVAALVSTLGALRLDSRPSTRIEPAPSNFQCKWKSVVNTRPGVHGRNRTGRERKPGYGSREEGPFLFRQLRTISVRVRGANASGHDPTSNSVSVVRPSIRLR